MPHSFRTEISAGETQDRMMFGERNCAHPSFSLKYQFLHTFLSPDSSVGNDGVFGAVLGSFGEIVNGIVVFEANLVIFGAVRPWQVSRPFQSPYPLPSGRLRRRTHCLSDLYTWPLSRSRRVT